MKIWWVAFLLTAAQTAFATDAEVVFFGGYGSTATQMRCWEEGARNSSSANDYAFKAIEYPAGATPSAASAVSKASAVIRKIVDEINSHPQRQYVIVGHSSGAAVSNQVARLAKNPARIELVNLDGFAPDAALQKRVARSTCWYAVNPSTGTRSPNAGSMNGNCENSKPYYNKTCKTSWCMHFSLVNKSAPANLGSPEYKIHGYQGCATNLEFLKSDEIKTAPPLPRTGAK